MIKNLIFDWSGTLADDLPCVLRTTNAMLAHFGQEVMSEAQFRETFRLPFTEFYDEVLPGVALEELQRLYRHHFPEDGVVPMLEHAREMLEYGAATGRRLVLLSSAPLEHFEKQAGVLGVRDFFERVSCGVVDKRAELVRLLAELDMRPEETAFIGDMRHDIDAAHAAGVISVAVATGYESVPQLMTAQPEVLLRNLAALPRLLGGWQVRESAFPVATVGALILDEVGRCLMIRTHKWGHRWGIPGGKIQRGESCEEALRREILEETGLPITNIRFVMVQDCIEPPEFQRSAHFLLLNYVALCPLPEPQVVLNEEAQEFRWVTLEEAWELDLNGPTQVLLEAYGRMETVGNAS
jgi:phosphoglycolate phosphatase